MDINSLPQVSSQQLSSMQKAADKMMAEAGVIIPHPEIQAVAKMSTTDDKVSTVSPYAKATEDRPQQAWQLQANDEPEYVEAESELAAHEDHDHEDEVQSEDNAAVQEVSPTPTKTPASMAKRKTPAESFSELKAKAERLERENQEYLRKLYERENYNQAAKSQQQNIIQQQPEEDLDFKLADDDLADGKVVNKVDKKVRNLENQLKQYQQQAQMAATEAKLKYQYADFDKVVSKDNLDMLSYTYPELANSINSTQDLYSKAVSAYTMIKNLGIHKEEQFVEEKKRIQANALKPRLSPAVAAQQQGESPLTKANMFAEGLTPELQQQLKREMELARRGY